MQCPYCQSQNPLEAKFCHQCGQNIEGLALSCPQHPGMVNLAQPEMTMQVVQESVLGLWEVVNNLTRLQLYQRDRYRVTIFGSARIQPDHSLYHDVRYLASELTRMGCDIVTGGGPGLMEAANEGSVMADPENKLSSIGIRINLGFEQETNPFVEKLYQHRTFFSRLHHFVLLSDAFVVMPGGIGTTLECLMIWQLLQVRHLNNIPLIMLGTMWSDLVIWAKTYMAEVEPNLANPEDIAIPNCVDNVEEALVLLRQYQGQWLQCRS